jgi:hypothetical protein
MTYSEIKRKNLFMLDMIKQTNPDCYLDAWKTFYNHIANGDFNFMDKQSIEWSKKCVKEAIEKEEA